MADSVTTTALVPVQKVKTITASKARKIVRVLKKDPAAVNYCPKFRHWVKQRRSRLITHTTLGLTDVLCLLAKKVNRGVVN